MQLASHTPSDYADAQRALLPPGAAFDWPQGGMGTALLLGMAQELARVGDSAQPVLDRAIEQHRPKQQSWNIAEYRRVAQAALAGVSETLPRRAFTVGSRVGQRLWSQRNHQVFAVGSHVGDPLWSGNTPRADFPVELCRVDHLLGPFRVGSKAGDSLWSAHGRYVLRVRYYSSVVDPKPLWDALMAMKQAHVFLWFEDITGAGGNYGQN